MRQVSSLVERLIEDSLRTILELEREGLRVSPPSIVRELGMDADEAPAVLEALEERGLAECDRQGWVHLTGKGRSQAKEVLSRHETIEGFFEEVLGVEEAHTEAHALEHVISYPVLAVMEKLRSERERAVALSRIGEGEELDVVFLDLSDQRILDRAIGMGLVPGQEVKVIKKVHSDFLVLEVQGKNIAVDKEIGDHIYGVTR